VSLYNRRYNFAKPFDHAQEKMQLEHALEESIAYDFKQGYLAPAFEQQDPMTYEELANSLPSAFRASRLGRTAMLEAGLQEALTSDGCDNAPANAKK
jgi:hypothetical protein